MNGMNSCIWTWRRGLQLCISTKFSYLLFRYTHLKWCVFQKYWRPTISIWVKYFCETYALLRNRLSHHSQIQVIKAALIKTFMKNPPVALVYVNSKELSCLYFFILICENTWISNRLVTYFTVQDTEVSFYLHRLLLDREYSDPKFGNIGLQYLLSNFFSKYQDIIVYMYRFTMRRKN